MNIFASYSCPVKSAQLLDDSRVVKMQLESCQMLSTAAFVLGKWDPQFTKPTHANHPCAVWVREGRTNFEWLVEHLLEMDRERKKRWGDRPTHVTLDRCLKAGITRVQKSVPRGSTPHVNCARNIGLGIDFTHVEDTHLAYRLYLKKRWLTQKRPAICTIVGLLEDHR